MTESTGRQGIIFLIIVLAVLVDGFATVPTTGGDTYGTILVADSLFRFASLSLEHYSKETLELFGSRIESTNGLPFYYFPLGSSLLSLPLVGLADVFGFDVIAGDSLLQRIMAAVSSALTLLLMLRIGVKLRTDWSWWLVPCLFWFGTALSTATGTALESHNFAIVFALIAIDIVLGMGNRRSFGIWGIIGIALFLSYLTRPTFAIFTVYLLLWTFTLSRTVAIKSALVVAVLLGVFVLTSMKVYGQILPDYYLPKRLAGGETLWALIGNLISPARGLLVYSSFIAIAWLFPKSGSILQGSGWIMLCVIWPLTHLLIISRFPHWWGGHSYGPRLMIDCLPGLFLLTLSYWPSLAYVKCYKVRSLVLFFGALLSLYVNFWQGMFNIYTAHWSNAPDIDRYPEYLFDWRYPPFLANVQGHQIRAAEFTAIHHRAAWEKQPQGQQNP